MKLHINYTKKEGRKEGGSCEGERVLFTCSYQCFCPVEPDGNATCRAKSHYSQWGDITLNGVPLLSVEIYYSWWTSSLTLTEALLHSIAYVFIASRVWIYGAVVTCAK